MAGRPAQPWFYAAKNSWYVWVCSKKVSLKVKGKENRAAALVAWHKLMGSDEPKPALRAKRGSVRQVIDGFLADAEGRVSPECLRNYRKHLLPFAKKHGPRPAEALTAAEAEAYVRKPEWSPSYRNGILGSLISAC
jgi:hypothetical protein